MTIRERAKLALSPPAKLSEHNTGLTFTDILFGFVISQIFLRLQHFGELPTFVRWQLIVSTALVLGSWIGFRRSRNRSSYELKFFNMPLARFIVDQLMIVLYFRIAVLAPVEATTPRDPSQLTNTTIETLAIIFGLYVVWDIGGLIMGGARGRKKYEEASADWYGFGITLFFAVLVAGLLFLTSRTAIDGSAAGMLLAAATVLLLAYRWAKEIRSTFKDPSESAEGTPAAS